MRIAHANSDAHNNRDGYTRCSPGWSAGGILPTPGSALGWRLFPGQREVLCDGRPQSDTAGSDFTHPFEYNPAANTWTTKGATYADNQVNNMACGVLTDAGTPYIYCVGGSAAGATVSTVASSVTTL